MSQYNTLKAAVADVIKTNGTNAITGAILQQSLLAMIDSLGAGYQMMGVATPSTNPGTPDQNIVYIAGPGTYSNMGGLVVAANEIAILYYNGTWHKETFLSGLITRQLLDDGIVQLYDGTTPIFPRTKGKAIEDLHNVVWMLPANFSATKNSITFQSVQRKERTIETIYVNNDHTPVTFSLPSNDNYYLVLHSDNSFAVVQTNEAVLLDDIVLLRSNLGVYVGGELLPQVVNYLYKQTLLKDITHESDVRNLLVFGKCEYQKGFDTDGSVIDADGKCISDYIDIRDYPVIYFWKKTITSNNFRVVLYDAEKNIIECTDVTSALPNSISTLLVEEKQYVYMRIGFQSYYDKNDTIVSAKEDTEKKFYGSYLPTKNKKNTSVNQSEKYYKEYDRPEYHITAESGWMNDANGFVFYKGKYHLFFQLRPGINAINPREHISWGHMVSDDLLHWEHRPISLTAGDKDYSIFSGCAFIDELNATGLGAGTLLLFYSVNRQSDRYQFVHFAYSYDGENFTDYPGNPILYPNVSIRDPYIAYDEVYNRYLMVVATEGGNNQIFKSTDLINWTLLSTTPYNCVCPLLFKQGNRWFYIISMRTANAIQGIQIVVNENDITYSSNIVVLGYGSRENGYFATNILHKDNRVFMIGWLRQNLDSTPNYKTDFSTGHSGQLSVISELLCGFNGSRNKLAIIPFDGYAKESIYCKTYNGNGSFILGSRNAKRLNINCSIVGQSNKTIAINFAGAIITINYANKTISVDRTNLQYQFGGRVNYNSGAFISEFENGIIDVFFDNNSIEIYSMGQYYAETFLNNSNDNIVVTVGTGLNANIDEFEMNYLMQHEPTLKTNASFINQSKYPESVKLTQDGLLLAYVAFYDSQSVEHFNTGAIKYEIPYDDYSMKFDLKQFGRAKLNVLVGDDETNAHSLDIEVADAVDNHLSAHIFHPITIEKSSNNLTIKNGSTVLLSVTTPYNCKFVKLSTQVANALTGYGCNILNKIFIYNLTDL